MPYLSPAGKLTPLADALVWRRFVESYPWGVDAAEEFRSWARGATDGGGEPKRLCDVAAKAPFAPTNLRMFRQTHAAFALLLR